MNTVYHPAASRGLADHGWLLSRHTFSFANYHNPDRMHFGLLRVLNDDLVQGGQGFGTHPHDNMEIVSIPLKGALAHKDSTGRQAIIKTGDVQIMSAGSGIQHSEMNASSTEPVNFLQLWVYPQQLNITPRYEQKFFDAGGRLNRLQEVVTPQQGLDGIWINQQSWFTLTQLEAQKTLTYQLHGPGQGVYVFMLEGAAQVAGQPMQRRDGLGIWDTELFTLTAEAPSELLFVEVPMAR